jgi:hypothetical protein
VLRGKIEEEEELLASPIQGEEVIQGDIATKNVRDTNKMDNNLMSRIATIELLFSILHEKNPFLEMCQILMHICQ